MESSPRPLAPKAYQPRLQARQQAHSRGPSTLSTPPRSKRGAPKFELKPEVARCITKLITSTAVPFGKIAQALEDADGPEKQWLRDFMGRISEIARFGESRLHNLCPKDAKIREEQQRKAIASAPHTLKHNPTDVRLYAQPGGARAKPQSPLKPGILGFPEHSRRSSIRIATSGNGTIGHESLGAHSLPSPTSPTTKRMKRPFPAEPESKEPLSYSERSNRTRNVSVKAITENLGNATGEHDLFDYIGRRCSAVAASVISHFSPIARRSKRHSGETFATNEQSSPEMDEVTRVRYVADPDYLTFYHQPASDQIQSVRTSGAWPVLHLMQARVSEMSDEQAETQLVSHLPNTLDERKRYVRLADDNGVTALHLAVAYGYPRVCGVLLKQGAHARALTKRGNSACRFARPSEDLVGTDFALYYRISICRTFVCSGRTPPVPSGISASSEVVEQKKPVQKRVKIEATPPLSTVQEVKVESPLMHARYGPPQQIRRSIEETTLTPWLNNCGFHENYPDLEYYFGQPIVQLGNGAMQFQQPDPSSASWASDSLSPISAPYASISNSGSAGLVLNALGITSAFPEQHNSDVYFFGSDLTNIAPTLYSNNTELQTIDQTFDSSTYLDNHYMPGSIAGLQTQSPILQERNQNQNYPSHARDHTPYSTEARLWLDCPDPYAATQMSSLSQSTLLPQTAWLDKENETSNE